MPSSSTVKVLATRGSAYLADGICRALEGRLPSEFFPRYGGIRGETRVERFSNENLQVRLEQSVRGHLAVVVHTQAPPVSEGLIELFALLDAVVNAQPDDILLVFSYMPDSRSDKKDNPRISTLGALWPRILNMMGIKRVLLLDPHDSHLKHYYYPAAEEISAIYLIADHLNNVLLTPAIRTKSVVVFPDAGSAKRFEQMTRLLNLPGVYIDKKRDGNNERPQVNGVVGDVRGKICIIVDDEILTGNTVIVDAETLLTEGASSVWMVATHPILAHNELTTAQLMEKLEESPIEKFIVTDSVPVVNKIKREITKFTVISVASLFAEAIKRTIVGESISAFHNLESVALYR